MRCVACDKVLSNYELTKKFSGSGQFVDMCNDCSRFLADDDLTAIGNLDYADLYDLEGVKYVEDEPLDYDTGTEQGNEGEWT
tara:strand:+ start:2701 stop:2946 length:246 start_codon:yes stop_codon:yes gene_type:complete